MNNVQYIKSLADTSKHKIDIAEDYLTKVSKRPTENQKIFIKQQADIARKSIQSAIDNIRKSNVSDRNVEKNKDVNKFSINIKTSEESPDYLIQKATDSVIKAVDSVTDNSQIIYDTYYQTIENPINEQLIEQNNLLTDRINQLNVIINAREMTIQTLRDDIKDLENQASLDEREILRLQAQITILNNQIAVLQAQIIGLNGQVVNLTKLLSDSKIEINNLETEIQKLTNEKKQLINDYEIKLSDAKKKIKDLEDNNKDSLNGAFNDIKNIENDYESEIKELNDKIDLLNTQLLNVKNNELLLNQQIIQLKTENKQLNSEIETLNEEKKKLQNQIHTMNESIKRMKIEAEEIKKRYLNNLQRLKDEYKKELEKYDEERNKKEQILNDKIKDLENKHQIDQKEIEDLKSKIDENDKTIDDLKSKVDALTAKYHSELTEAKKNQRTENKLSVTTTNMQIIPQNDIPQGTVASNLNLYTVDFADASMNIEDEDNYLSPRLPTTSDVGTNTDDPNFDADYINYARQLYTKYGSNINQLDQLIASLENENNKLLRKLKDREVQIEQLNSQIKNLSNNKSKKNYAALQKKYQELKERLDAEHKEQVDAMEKIYAKEKKELNDKINKQQEINVELRNLNEQLEKKNSEIELELKEKKQEIEKNRNLMIKLLDSKKELENNVREANIIINNKEQEIKKLKKEMEKYANIINNLSALAKTIIVYMKTLGMANIDIDNESDNKSIQTIAEKIASNNTLDNNEAESTLIKELKIDDPRKRKEIEKHLLSISETHATNKTINTLKDIIDYHFYGSGGISFSEIFTDVDVDVDEKSTDLEVKIPDEPDRPSHKILNIISQKIEQKHGISNYKKSITLQSLLLILQNIEHIINTDEKPWEFGENIRSKVIEILDRIFNSIEDNVIQVVGGKYSDDKYIGGKYSDDNNFRSEAGAFILGLGVGYVSYYFVGFLIVILILLILYFVYNNLCNLSNPSDSNNGLNLKYNNTIYNKSDD